VSRISCGVPIYKPNDECLWYYWLDGKQGYYSGWLWARTRIGARRKIKKKHPNNSIDSVLHQDQYHGRSQHCPLDRGGP